MKLQLLVCTICFVGVLSSCRKNNDHPPAPVPAERTVKFVLYTSKNYSGNNQEVIFTLRMRAANNILWDSVLAPVKLKDIPGPDNKRVIEKKVPGNSNEQLLAGFVYTIENVGGYWYNDVFNAGEKLKTISLDFR